ncbi:MAG: hypothetical protein GY754_08340 [bacterium]|nr:hypothetical protein [bacterium]
MEIILEIICGPLGHFFLRLFGRKNKEIDTIDELVGAIIIIGIPAITIFILVKTGVFG